MALMTCWEAASELPKTDVFCSGITISYHVLVLDMKKQPVF